MSELVYTNLDTISSKFGNVILSSATIFNMEINWTRANLSTLYAMNDRTYLISIKKCLNSGTNAYLLLGLF